MNNAVKFFPKPTVSKLTKQLSDLYYAIDFMVVTCPADLNPMTDDGYNFWDWGVIKIGDTEIPAPYKEYGITASGRKVALSAEQSAITNTAIWLERLLSYYSARKQGKDLMQLVGPMGMMQLAPAFKLFDSKGVDKIQNLIQTLMSKCYDDADMYSIID